jgi:hypothetical protein
MRFLFKLFFLLILLASIGLGYLWLNRVQLATHYLSEIVGADVTLRDISFTPHSITIEDIEIKNPNFGATLTAGNVAVVFQLYGMTTSPVTIEKVYINNARLVTDLSENTLIKIPKSLFNKAKNLVSENPPTEKQITVEQDPKGILIKQLVVTNLNILIKNVWKDQKVNVKQLVLYNLKSDGQGLAQVIIQNLVSQF